MRRGEISKKRGYAALVALFMVAVGSKWLTDEIRRRAKLGWTVDDPERTRAGNRLWDVAERTLGILVPYGGPMGSSLLRGARSVATGKPFYPRENLIAGAVKNVVFGLRDGVKWITEEDAEKRAVLIERALLDLAQAVPGGGGLVDTVDTLHGALGFESYQSIKAAYRNAYADFHKSKESLRDRQQALNKAVTAIRKRAETAGIKNFKTIETSSKAWATRTLKAKKK